MSSRALKRFSVIPGSDEECPAVFINFNLHFSQPDFKENALYGGQIRSYLPWIM